MTNPKLLLLRIEGPLQSWGVRAKWDIRDTADSPTKSGIIGLIGSALGYKRRDARLEQLDQELTMGIRIESDGKILSDFHTVQGILPTAENKTRGKEKDPATIVSTRNYLQDAAFLVVLSGNEKVLSKVENSLKNPQWTLYLGRKSCIPTRPIFEKITYEYETIKVALTKHPWDWSGSISMVKKPQRLKCYLENPTGESLRNDVIKVNPSRMYGARRETVFHVDFPAGS